MSSTNKRYCYINSKLLFLFQKISTTCFILILIPVFQKSIDTVYRNLIGNTRYPFIVLNLEIPPCDVDVNVHPTKKEVRYKNPNQIFNFIYTSVNMALKSAIRIEEPIIATEDSKVQPIKPIETMPEDIFVDSKASISDVFIRPEEKQEAPLYNIRPKEDSYSKPSRPVTPVQSKLISEPEFKEEDVIIGQYKKTYILIEKENGLEIVDQHIADERYIYEKLRKFIFSVFHYVGSVTF